MIVEINLTTPLRQIRMNLLTLETDIRHVVDYLKQRHPEDEKLIEQMFKIKGRVNSAKFATIHVESAAAELYFLRKYCSKGQLSKPLPLLRDERTGGES